MTSQTLEFTRVIHASPAEAYRALTSATALREWLADGASADARVGGRLCLWWNSGYYMAGTYTALEPPKHVAFTWHGRGEPGLSQVEVHIEEVADGVQVTLVHSSLGSGPEWTTTRKEAAEGWRDGMEALASALETGEDLRLLRRPMVGIYTDDFNAEIASKLGVPVTEGFRLSGVIEGMGAQKAGLQKDDVIVAIDGQDASTWTAFASIMQHHRAGDVVTVTFYRGADKRSVPMILSSRPLPAVPATPQALADAVSQLYQQTDAALAKALAGVSDEEARRPPMPGEWSALETVAHFVAGERENQTWITDLIVDDERWSDRFTNTTNVSARLGAIVAQYPTVEGMLALLQRTEAETVAMLAALPPEFVAHKASYVRLARGLIQLSEEHLDDHIQQIHAAIQAARS